MTRATKVRIGAIVGLVLVGVASLIAQGPLTALGNLMGRTDNNGYLLTSMAAYGGTDGPLTPLSNLRVRTDNNGYLLTTLSSSSSLAGILTSSVNGIASVSTDGLILQNATAATGAATVQMSPRLRLRGTAWDTAASETTDYWMEVLPSTAATPLANWKLGYSLNGAGATYPLIVNQSGAVTALQGFIAPALGYLAFTGSGDLRNTADGNWTIETASNTIGVRIKADALPSVSLCGGGSPAVTAGSTPLAGSVTVGTTVSTCTITFGGTAFPSAPFCIANVATATAGTTRVIGTTTTTGTLVIVPASNFVDSSVVAWHCFGSK